MYMDIDIEIYLKKLKDFFSRDEEARKDMFGHSERKMKQTYYDKSICLVIQQKQT